MNHIRTYIWFWQYTEADKTGKRRVIITKCLALQNETVITTLQDVSNRE